MMVMFATASTASLKKTNDVVIMLKNQEKALHVNAFGKVTATDISLAQFFSMESVGDFLSETFKISLYAKDVGRYLCFRKGKLVGMKSLTRDCHFIESLEHGYFSYANAYNPQWRVGFTRLLKPIGPRHYKKPQSIRRACFQFVKISAEVFDRATAKSVATTTTTLKNKPLREHERRRHDAKASIIDSNINKTVKSDINGSKSGDDNRWLEGRDFIRQQHRKRKHQTKPALASAAVKMPQPKNLLRMRHEEGHAKERRRQHEREKKLRRMRLKNQRTRKPTENDEEDNDDNKNESIPNATNSATPSVAATTLAATASLAPSALNIVAMLAAGHRKKGRRKKQIEAKDKNLSSSNSQHHQQQTVDLQLVAQSPLKAQSQYDLLTSDIDHLNHSKHHRLRHEHNYHQQYETAKLGDHEKPQQNHKYSNINNNNLNNRDSHLYSNNLKTNLSFSHKDNHSNNAIPALPKKLHLSKNNHQINEYFINNTRSPTDFNTKVDNISHKSKSTNPYTSQQHLKNDNSEILHPQNTQKHSNIRSKNSHTSHILYKIPLKNFKLKSDLKKESDSDEKDDDEEDEDDYNNNYNKNKNNSNRLLDNNSNIRDNNFQEQEHLVNRLKQIYQNRISHSYNYTKTNENKLNNTKQQEQHYNINTKNSDSISSSFSKSISSSSSTNTASIAYNKQEKINYSHLNLNAKQNAKNSNSSSKSKSGTATTLTNINNSRRRSRRNIYINNENNTNIKYKNNVLDNNNDNVNISNINQFNLVMLTAYRNRIFLGQQQQHEQQLLNKNSIKYNYNDDNEDVKGNVEDDEKFKRIQNKYKTIIVQYRSVVYLLVKQKKKFLNIAKVSKSFKKLKPTIS